jgi:hypothetical protein
VPVILRELDVHAEPPLPRFFLPQQSLLVGFHLNYISALELKTCLYSVVLLVRMGKCLAIVF